MSSARIEEVSDDDDMASDPEEMDPSAFDFAQPQHGSLRSAVDPGASILPPETITAMLSPNPASASSSSASTSGPGGRNPFAGGSTPQERARHAREQEAATKHYQCLYPVYFDATRTRAEGRRVGAAEAVANPLAREIVDALSAIGNAHRVPLQIVLEPGKTHPRDWANPGRVRVLIKDKGKTVHTKIANKHYLYKLVAEYLRAHPTTTDSPMRLRIQGLPMPKDNKLLPPAVPRGMKMGTVLPLHSPALSGGGVSDNMLKDMMAEMGGQMPGGMPGLPSGMPGGMPGLPSGMPGMSMGLGGGDGGGAAAKKANKKKK